MLREHTKNFFKSWAIGQWFTKFPNIDIMAKIKNKIKMVSLILSLMYIYIFVFGQWYFLVLNILVTLPTYRTSEAISFEVLKTSPDNSQRKSSISIEFSLERGQRGSCTTIKPMPFGKRSTLNKIPALLIFHL